MYKGVFVRTEIKASAEIRFEEVTAGGDKVSFVPHISHMRFTGAYCAKDSLVKISLFYKKLLFIHIGSSWTEILPWQW